MPAALVTTTTGAGVITGMTVIGATGMTPPFIGAVCCTGEVEESGPEFCRGPALCNGEDPSVGPLFLLDGTPCKGLESSIGPAPGRVSFAYAVEETKTSKADMSADLNMVYLWHRG